MPVYIYECKNCGHKCEALKDRCASADDSQACSQCGDSMTRIMSGIGAAYKGKGFYSTDYKQWE